MKEGIRILNLGKKNRELQYYKTTCLLCHSQLIFEYGDMWAEDVDNYLWRISCPVCRTKIFLRAKEKPMISLLENATKEEYDNANAGASKSGLEMLAEERKKEINMKILEEQEGGANMRSYEGIEITEAMKEAKEKHMNEVISNRSYVNALTEKYGGVNNANN